MRTLTLTETSLLLGGGTWTYSVRVKRPTDAAWINLSDALGGDWVTSVRVEPATVDQPVGRFSFALVRKADGQSVAPGISAATLNRNDADEYAPLIYPGNLVEAYAQNGGPSRLWLKGKIASGAWASDVTATCNTLDKLVENTWIKEEEERGSPDSETPIPDEIQGLLDRWLGTGVVDLLTLGDPEAALGPYKPAKGSLGAQNRAHAQRVGWDLRYRWSEASDAFRYTLYLPPRDKTTPDLSLAGMDVRAVPGLEVSIENVRNSFTGKFIAPADGEQITRTRINAASVLQFEEQWMELIQDEKSPIRSAEQMDALLAFADNDLSQPLTELKAQIPFIPWLELHDVIEIEADGINFDFTQIYSVVGVSHVVDGANGAYTEVDLRGGSPVGMYYAWFRFGGRTSDLIEPEVLGVEVLAKTDTYLDVRATVSATVSELRVADILYTLPLTGSELPLESDFSTDPLDRGEVYRLFIPPQGHQRILWLAPYTESLVRGPVRKFELGPAQISVPLIEYVDVAPGSAANKGDVTIRVRDPQGLGGTLNVWTAPASASDPNKAGPPDASIALASTPATVGPADSSALDEVSIHPSRGKTLYVEFINADGVSSEIRSHYVHGFSTAITFDDALRPAIVNALALADEAVEAAKIKQRAVGTLQLALSGVQRDNLIDEAVSAAKVKTGTLDLTEFSRVVLDNAIAGGKLAVNELSEIVDNAGIIVSGELRNAAGTRFIDLDATGSQPFIHAQGALTVRADGTASFAGLLDAAGGTFTGTLSGVNGTFTGTLTGNTIAGLNGTFGTITGGSFVSADGNVEINLESARGWFIDVLDSAMAMRLRVGHDGSVRTRGVMQLIDGLADNQIEFYASDGTTLLAEIDAYRSTFGADTLDGLAFRVGGSQTLTLYQLTGQRYVYTPPTVNFVPEKLMHASTQLGFWSSSGLSAKPTVTGSRGGNAALASLLTVLQSYGLITNSSS